MCSTENHRKWTYTKGTEREKIEPTLSVSTVVIVSQLVTDFLFLKSRRPRHPFT